jgi:hypothetical protein
MSERNHHAELTSRGVNFVLRHRKITAHLASTALRRVGALAGSATVGTLGLLLAAAPGCVELGGPADAQASPGHTVLASSGTAAQDDTIRPFRVNVSDEELADLRRRIIATRWPEKETVPDASQGVQLATMQKLAKYWANGYDWRKVESQLNALPQFVTTIDGLDIHFIHVRSKHPNALPVIVTHGWPGSIVDAQDAVVLQQVRERLGGGQVVDRHDLDVLATGGGRPVEVAPDPAETVDAHSYGHS